MSDSLNSHLFGTPQVFITQCTNGRDYSKAACWGDLVEVCRGRHEIYPDSGPEQARLEITRKMKDFVPHRDYLLLSGDPVIMALVFKHVETIRRDGCYSAIKVLKWSGKINDYFTVEI